MLAQHQRGRQSQVRVNNNSLFTTFELYFSSYFLLCLTWSAVFLEYHLQSAQTTKDRQGSLRERFVQCVTGNTTKRHNAFFPPPSKAQDKHVYANF